MSTAPNGSDYNRNVKGGRNIDKGLDPERLDDYFIPDLCTPQAVFFLVLVAELLVFALVIFTGGLVEFNWSLLARVSFFVQWVVLLSAGALCQSRAFLARYPANYGAVFSFGMILCVTTGVTLLGQWLLGSLLAQPRWDGMPLLRNLILASIFGGLTLRYFYIQQQLRLQQQAELRARIQALQSRIRPHFLFNSMNIIASLIAIDPENAEKAVEDLSTLFRASLSEAGIEVSLAHELSLCYSYIRIEQLRLGDRLQVYWEVEPGLEDLKIPSLTLQPLLENAIYHGVQPLPEGGAIYVNIHRKQGNLAVEIRNPFDRSATALGQYKGKGNRIALTNIRSRLQALYGPGASLAAHSDGDTFVTYLHYAVESGNAIP